MSESTVALRRTTAAQIRLLAATIVPEATSKVTPKVAPKASPTAAPKNPRPSSAPKTAPRAKAKATPMAPKNSRPNPAPNPKLKAPKILPNDTLVTITSGTGSKSKNFLIHKKFASQSPVFASAFESDFIEGQTQVYELDDVSEEVVQLLIHWFYTQTFEPDYEIEATPKWLTPEEIAAYSSVMRLAVQIWALADRLLLPALQNQVMNWIYGCMQEVEEMPILAFNEVYELTGPGSELRGLFVTFYARHRSSRWLLEMPDRFPAEMLLELVVYHTENSSPDKNLEAKESFHVEVLES